MAPKHNERYTRGAKYARRKRNRRIALIVAAVSALGVSTLGIIAFLGRVSGNFTIRVDPRRSDPLISLSLLPNSGPTTTFLKANGLSAATPAGGDTVYNYVSEFFKGDVKRNENGQPLVDSEGNFIPNGGHLSGENTLKKKIRSNQEEVTLDQAIVYTFYLRNEDFRPIDYTMSMNLSAYTQPTNQANQPTDYLRIMIFENEVLNMSDPSSEKHDCTVYGAVSSSTYNTAYGAANGFTDHRECISQYYNPETHKTFTVRDPSLDKVAAMQGYCEPFLTTNDRLFEKRGIHLATAGVMRYTIVCWLEGYDPECFGTPPQGVEIAFDIHFAVD